MTTPLLNAADRDLLRAALDGALDQLRGLLAEFGPRFPDDTAPHDRYRPRRWLDLPDGANSGWTTGFWTGMLWLAHELSGETGFREAAEGHLASFEERLERRIQIDHPTSASCTCRRAWPRGACAATRRRAPWRWAPPTT